MRTTLRRVAAVAAALLALTLVRARPSRRPPPTRRRPATSAAAWLAGELTERPHRHQPESGRLRRLRPQHRRRLRRARHGQAPPSPTQIRDAVATHINDYITGEAFGDAGSTYAGPTAKALVFAQASGGDPTSFGGVNLVSRLEDGGRCERPARRMSRTFGDFANTIGQSFAARGLTAAGSAKAAADVTAFLLKQQCPAGFFRLDLGDTPVRGATPPAGHRRHRARGAEPPEPDVTKPEVAAALAKAAAWLVSTQAADGSFGGGA